MSSISSGTTSTTGYVVSSDTTGALVLKTGSSATTAVTIDTSQNVGIGTGSPSYKLQVEQASDTGFAMSNSGSVTSGNRGSLAMFNSSNSTVGLIRFGAVTDNVGTEIQFYTRPAAGSLTQTMTLSSAGNLGIGTSSPTTKLTVSGSSAIITTDGTTNTGARGLDFVHSGQSYGSLLNYAQTGETALTAGYTGSSGYFLTFKTENVERVRITNTGNVGIGTSSPSTKLTVSGPNSDIYGQLNVVATGAGADAQILFSTPLNGRGIYLDDSDTNKLKIYGGAGKGVVANEVTIDNDGDVGIGTSSPAVNGIDIVRSAGTSTYLRTSDGSYTAVYGIAPALGGALLGTSSNHPVAFYTNNTERARITSDGDFFIGNTTLSTSAGAGVKFLKAWDGAGNDRLAIIFTSSTGAAAPLTLYSTNASQFRFYVDGAGTIYATNTTITAISDVRLKENIRDLDDGLEKIMALQPRKFDWKAGKGKDIKGDRGWIAQEFEQVFPDMIGTWLDEPPEGEDHYKAVRADLIPTLVKAIQEQQVLIQQLQADVAILKGVQQ